MIDYVGLAFVLIKVSCFYMYPAPSFPSAQVPKYSERS